MRSEWHDSHVRPSCNFLQRTCSSKYIDIAGHRLSTLLRKNIPHSARSHDRTNSSKARHLLNIGHQIYYTKCFNVLSRPKENNFAEIHGGFTDGTNQLRIVYPEAHCHSVSSALVIKVRVSFPPL